MPKPKRIDLNDYEAVSSLEDLEGYTSLVIIPFKQEDGTQPPNICLRKRLSPFVEIKNVENAQWFQDCRINKKGSKSQYAERVNWWFKNAMLDEEYKDLLNDAFSDKGFNLPEAFERAKLWLKGRTVAQRKTYIHKFVWNWLTKSAQWAKK